MSFFESLRWQAAPKSFFQQMASGLTMCVFAALCSLAVAQSTPNAQESIKKALQAGQLDLAAKLVQQERERSPKDVQMRFMEGVIQAQQGQTDKAIDTFKNIIQSHPELSEAYNNLGVLYAAKGRLEESRNYLEKALQTHPSYAAAHRNLSDVLSQLAKQSYAKALQVDPKVKNTPPQLTLLGSIGPEKRNQPPSTSVTVKIPPATTVAAAPTPAAATAYSSKATKAFTSLLSNMGATAAAALALASWPGNAGGRRGGGTGSSKGGAVKGAADVGPTLPPAAAATPPAAALAALAVLDAEGASFALSSAFQV
jgi:tetratricopeptide (TPR) repeat protein